MDRMLSRVRRALLALVALLLAGAPATGAFADDGGGHGRHGRQLFIYQMQPSTLDAAAAAALAGRLGLSPVGQGTTPGTAPASDGGPGAFADAGGHVRMLFADGGVKIFPDLTKPPNPNGPPGRGGALRMALEFLNGAGGMQGAMREFKVGEIVTLTEQPGQVVPAGAAGLTGGTSELPAVQTGQAVDVLRTVEFRRQLDGLDVFGPTSILSVDVGAGGVVGGVIDLRPVAPTGTPVQIISRGDATKQFVQQFPYPVKVGGDDDAEEDAGTVHAAAVTGGAAATGFVGRLVSARLIYYEQGGPYLQPAYLFSVVLIGPLGTRDGVTWLLPAVQRTPEPIRNFPVLDLPPAAQPGQGSPPLPPACAVPEAIQYGRYVLRDDATGWLTDAQGFGANIDGANTGLRFWDPARPTVTNAQFYWNYPWLWEPTGSPATDQSPFFPGSVNVALIEGHGLPWWISTEKNCCDVIDLRNITGFGGYHDPGELTDYVIWQSCDVIPAPGDPYGGNYISPATPWDVWFTVFQGMRGTYGYRTTMNIWNGVGAAFGGDLGWGAANLPAWFTECDNNVFHHGGGWNYGSAVVVSGQEGDSLYDTCPLPPPGSLTIWWQHP